MLSVKISMMDEPSNLLSQQLPKNHVVGNCLFSSEIDECDWWVVLSGITSDETMKCPPNHTIFVTGEPPSVRKYRHDFLNQFSIIVTVQDKIRHPHVIQTHQLLPYWISKTYDELLVSTPSNKCRDLSIISSNKKITKGHRKRYEFATSLKEYFGDRIDLYGRGIRDFDCKDDVLLPYKYSVVLENSRYNNYITEKLSDAFLTYTYPIYSGAPNLSDYYNPEAYTIIDIDDFEGSVNSIESILDDSLHYQRHLSAVSEARHEYLYQYHLFPALSRIINSLDPNKSINGCSITLHPEKINYSDVLLKLKTGISWII